MCKAMKVVIEAKATGFGELTKNNSKADKDVLMSLSDSMLGEAEQAFDRNVSLCLCLNAEARLKQILPFNPDDLAELSVVTPLARLLRNSLNVASRNETLDYGSSHPSGSAAFFFTDLKENCESWTIACTTSYHEAKQQAEVVYAGKENKAGVLTMLTVLSSAPNLLRTLAASAGSNLLPGLTTLQGSVDDVKAAGAIQGHQKCPQSVQGTYWHQRFRASTGDERGAMGVRLALRKPPSGNLAPKSRAKPSRRRRRTQLSATGFATTSMHISAGITLPHGSPARSQSIAPQFLTDSRTPARVCKMRTMYDAAV